MARRKTKSPSPLKRWWRSQSEYHYQAYTFMTLFCLAASLSSFGILFGAQSISAFPQWEIYARGSDWS